MPIKSTTTVLSSRSHSFTVDGLTGTRCSADVKKFVATMGPDKEQSYIFTVSAYNISMVPSLRPGIHAFVGMSSVHTTSPTQSRVNRDVTLHDSHSTISVSNSVLGTSGSKRQPEKTLRTNRRRRGKICLGDTMEANTLCPEKVKYKSTQVVPIHALVNDTAKFAQCLVIKRSRQFLAKPVASGHEKLDICYESRATIQSLFWIESGHTAENISTKAQFVQDTLQRRVQPDDP
ncbi:hypothetical protein C8R43DRAFT_965873 [Mycena crocata]|nr:hypothetical protein C8R43DRAFT_965873 [Mycena crocata]